MQNELSKTNGFPAIDSHRKPTLDISILTLNDLERIRKNAKIFTKEEEANHQRLFTEQRDAQMAKSKALKEKLIAFDKTRHYCAQSDIELENEARDKAILAEAKRALTMNEDVVKEMNKMVLYAKTATIRDRQLNERKELQNIYHMKEVKADTMMEIERLKELKYQEDKEMHRKKEQKEGAMIIVDQIKDRELLRLKNKEILAQEGIQMLKKIKENDEEDLRLLELKRLKGEQLIKEVTESNKLAYAQRDKAKIAEKELNLKIMKYNMDKARKEEEDLAEKKRIRDEIEKETQKLREKQEKAQDKQSVLDALRAKRAFEDNERALRIKERQELIIKQKKIEDLLAANKRQKIDKELKLAEQAKQEQEEYEKIIITQIESLEREKRIQEEKKRLRYDHNHDVLKQIKLKEENFKVGHRHILEEGRKIKQNLDDYHKRMEFIRLEKIRELKELDVAPKYIADLERFKIA